MRYLVIGDANSMHIYNFVKTVLIPNDYEIHLLTLSVYPLRDTYREFYKENGVCVHSIYEKGYKDLDKRDRLSRASFFMRKLCLMMEVPKVDVCHVQSVYPTSMVMLLLFRSKYKKLILSYWGGDVEDTRRRTIKLREPNLKRADCISVPVIRTQEQFEEIHGTKYRDKMLVSRFATNGLDCIHDIAEKHDLRYCRHEYDIPDGNICVTVGYSASAEQHQDTCLEILNTMPENLKQKMTVIVPMQYHRNNDVYIRKVYAKAKQCNFDVRILEEYAPFEKSVMLAIATDVYLHVLDTDAFSNSLKEQVYAGAIVIKGDWLIYRELDNMKANILSVPDFPSMSQLIYRILSGYEEKKSITLFEPIYDLYSTTNIVEQWNNVISFAVNGGRVCNDRLWLRGK